MKRRTFSPLHQTYDSIIQRNQFIVINNLVFLKLKTSQRPNQYDLVYSIILTVIKTKVFLHNF